MLVYIPAPWILWVKVHLKTAMLNCKLGSQKPENLRTITGAGGLSRLLGGSGCGCPLGKSFFIGDLMVIYKDL
jgi:hypothetical protein